MLYEGPAVGEVLVACDGEAADVADSGARSTEAVAFLLAPFIAHPHPLFDVLPVGCGCIGLSVVPLLSASLAYRLDSQSLCVFLG